MTPFYRAIELPSDEPVQYVGVYVLKWGKADQPAVGFVEDETLPDLLAALEAATPVIEEYQRLAGDMVQFGDELYGSSPEEWLAMIESLDSVLEQARAALTAAQSEA